MFELLIVIGLQEGFHLWPYLFGLVTDQLKSCVHYEVPFYTFVDYVALIGQTSKANDKLLL